MSDGSSTALLGALERGYGAAAASAAAAGPTNGDDDHNNNTAHHHQNHQYQRKRSRSLHDATPLLGNVASLAKTTAAATITTTTTTTSRGARPPIISKHSSLTATGSEGAVSHNSRDVRNIAKLRRDAKQKQESRNQRSKGGFLYYIIYAIVNVIISLPGLYGYAAVIFNHPIFNNHMNALSKLVIFSSLMHQLGFLLFSTLPFAIGTVQDAGLIFLSSMSNTIANIILAEQQQQDDDENDKQHAQAVVLSTTLVLLSLGTAMLGLVLIAMGRFGLANAVSYLPMPVVGGYLAFIGYFCLEAGVGLCISESMMNPMDWGHLGDPHMLLLAVPGLLAGLLLTYVSRNVESDVALPVAMCVIPALFYVIIFATGLGIGGAREGGWVGPEAPSVPVSDLLHLVDFELVRWDLIKDILATWTGMVFVVSFASCLDVAAISMDMGEALDTNKELATVGICNFMSGLTFGFTGSYIFSQTIFTYRTGVHSRWIGVFIMAVFLYVVTSPLNILQVAPLFFLGSTLIFIGFDLLYEWLIEIRHKVFLTEYAIVWATFIAIQVVGIDVGILIGVMVSIVEHVFLTAQISTVKRVSKQSRAVWTPSDYKLLHKYGYNPASPKIVTLEVVGTVFFGSSLQLLEHLTEEIGLDLDDEQEQDDAASTTSSEVLMKSPHQASRLLTDGVVQRRPSFKTAKQHPIIRRTPPKFIVLDLIQVPNLDASASRGCFLQLAKMCAKRGMVVCAAGASPRIDWMLRSHDVAYPLDEEERIKAQLQATRSALSPSAGHAPAVSSDRVLLFLTTHEALEFCENALIRDLAGNKKLDRKTPSFVRLDHYYTSTESASTVAHVVSHILGLDPEDEERQVLEALDGERYHSEEVFHAGSVVYSENTHSGAFYVVLSGAVAVARLPDTSSFRDARRGSRIVTGAGPITKLGSRSALLDPTLMSGDTLGGSNLTSFYPVGGVFGMVDYLLERPRRVRMLASQDGTVVAKFSRSNMALLRAENPALDAVLQKLLLQACVLDLANCTCRD